MNREHFFEAGLVFMFAFAIFLIAFSLSGCRSTVPVMNTTFWAGDSNQGGITRKQENKTLSCGDPEFDEYVCLTYEDLQEIWNTIQQCKEWSNVRLMSEKRMKKFYKHNKQVIDHVLRSENQSKH